MHTRYTGQCNYIKINNNNNNNHDHKQIEFENSELMERINVNETLDNIGVVF